MPNMNAAGLVLLAATGVGLVYSSREEPRPQRQVAEAPGRTAIHNVRLFNGTTVVENATIVFDESGILSTCSNCSAPQGVRMIDGAGKTLLPGLIDAHTHAFGDALERALVFGVTTEIDMFTAPSFAAERRAEQKNRNAFGRADIVSAGYLVTVAGGHGTEYGMPIPTFAKGMDPQKFIDDRLAEGSDFIKLVYDDGATFKLSFKSLDASDLAALIGATKKRGKLAVVHVSTSAAARDAVLAGANGLLHSWGDDQADDALFAEIARRGVFVVPTLSVLGSVAGRTESISVAKHPALAKYVNPADLAGLSAKFPASAHQKDALDNARQVVRRLRTLNVVVLAGTDAPNPGTAHGISIHREMELLVDSGLTAIEALRAATSVPARAFGLKDRGSIGPGQRADLVLVTGDPTTNISATQNIVTVWKGARAAPRVEANATATAAMPATLVDGVVSDFETGMGSGFGTTWMASTDQMMGGKSRATLSLVSGGPAQSTRALRVDGEIVTGQMYPWAGAMLMLSQTPMAAVDVRPMRELSFAVRSESPLRLMVFATGKGRIPVTKDLPATKGWVTVTVPLSELGLDGSDLQAVLISGIGGAFSYELDAVRLR
jgi:imidazolonepropionase-like amidohydrolase